ncbi:translocation/assembly module TamB domain-containing protein [Crenothrix sp.]|uniref:translocation/assembly module TamB domain-containing protein n=1 Tax=Crenothrix sp. TaxID=3100433 RepID=UPI00374D8AC2
MKPRYGLSILLVFLVLIPMGFVWLISDEAGSRWLLQRIFSMLPAQISVEKIQGRLIDRLSLTGLHYQSASQTLDIKQGVLIWQPVQLLSGTLNIVDLNVNGLSIKTISTKDEQKKPFDPTTLKLPVQIDINNLLVTDISFESEGELQPFDKLQLVAKTENNQLKIQSFSINSTLVNARAEGAVTLDKPFPLNLKANWQINADKNGVWQGSSTFSGDLDTLVFNNQITSPFKLTLQGNVKELLQTPRLNVQGDWHNLTWPLATKPPQLQSPQGHFELAGLLDNYQLSLNGALNQQYLPQASLSFKGTGSLDAISINKLELKSSTGVFQLLGNVNWGDLPQFDLTATGQKFNPGIVIAELPGNLTFTSHVKGKLDPKAWQITAEINQLTGQLRNYPVSANGKLALNGDQLKVDALHISSGSNKIAVNGQVGQTNNALIFSMDMPKLNTLWPTLAGNLQGTGRLQGSLKTPIVKLEVKGKRLQFAQHSTETVSLNVDYNHADQKIAMLHVAANGVKTGTTEISKLLIDGKGTLKQHDFKADIYSSKGNVSTLLKGSLLADTWKGEVSKLTLTEQNDNIWMLKNPMAIRVDQKPLGFDVSSNEGCLVRQSASLCIKGVYAASSDFNAQLTAKSLPTALIQPYLPEKVIVKSLINGTVDIQRQKNALKGNYKIALSPSQIFLHTQKIPQEINLGASSVAGTIKGDKVSADINLHLANRDYVQGQVLLDIGKTQAVSGKIAAKIADFSLVPVFVPQLSNTQGLLKADVTLQGTLQKPLITGYFDLTDGAVTIGQAQSGQMGLHSINLHAVTRGNRLQLHGSTLPVMLNKPDASRTIELKSLITIDANLQQKEVLSGNFRLSMPANTTISLLSPQANHKIVLGVSSLSGVINGESVNANLDIALTGADYVRAKLQMNTGNTQALSGQATASIRDLSFIEPFAPQLSNVKGLLSADMTLKGTTKQPLANGNISFSNGAANVDELGLNIHDVNLQATTSFYNSQQIQLHGSAKSGEGLVTLDGTVGLQPDLQYPVALTLTGKNFEVAKIPEAQIAVSPNLKIALTQQQRNITGQIEVPKALLKIQTLPENAVKVSADEIIIGEEKPQSTKLPAPDMNANIDVKLGEQVSFTGQGLQTNLVGNLQIIKTGDKMAMQGNVDMKKASYKRFGQQLTVRKGRLLFNGPVDNPWLDVEAIRESKDKKITALLTLSGQLKNPQALVSSEPALPETEALAYLVTGGPLNQVSKSDSNVLASAALSYAGGKAGWIADKLGINNFQVEEGNTLQDTLLAMGQYLTPDFYIGTKVGLFNKQASLVVKRKLTNTINVETQTGTSQRIKLNYEFDGD